MDLGHQGCESFAFGLPQCNASEFNVDFIVLDSPSSPVSSGPPSFPRE